MRENFSKFLQVPSLRGECGLHGEEAQGNYEVKVILSFISPDFLLTAEEKRHLCNPAPIICEIELAAYKVPHKSTSGAL